MFVFKGIFILLFLAANGVFSARLNDEYSIGTNLNKYLEWPNNKDDEDKRNGEEKRNTNNALWFGPRLGKRSSFEPEKQLPDELLEILEKIQKSPDLQNILAERFVSESPLISYLLSLKHHDSQLIAPRYLRESPDMNLNSRPYPPRYGRSLGELPPYLPRLG